MDELKLKIAQAIIKLQVALQDTKTESERYDATVKYDISFYDDESSIIDSTILHDVLTGSFGLALDLEGLNALLPGVCYELDIKCEDTDTGGYLVHLF